MADGGGPCNVPGRGSYLAALLVILTLPWVIWRGFGRPVWAPLVVVQTVMGTLLAPGLLRRLWPEVAAGLFSAPVLAALNGVVWWGGILFVWLAGLELDLGAVWAHRRETGVVAGLALVMPLAFGTAAAALLLRTSGWIGPKTQVWQAALGIGMACAVTALPILVLVLEELGLLGQPLGQRVLRYASLDDVAIWAVLAAILLDLERLGRQLGFLLVFALAGWSRRTACSWLWSGWSHPRLPPTGRAALGWHSFVRPC